MRLLILGATGGTGRQLTSQAVEHGHRVTAFVRSPQKLGSLRDRVTVRQGDPRSVAELQAILPGHDAVVSALGPPGAGPTTILRAAAGSTVTAMQAAGLSRLVVVSVAVLFDDLGIAGSVSAADAAEKRGRRCARNGAHRHRERSGLDDRAAAAIDQRPADTPLRRGQRTSARSQRRICIDQPRRRG